MHLDPMPLYYTTIISNNTLTLIPHIYYEYNTTTRPIKQPTTLLSSHVNFLALFETIPECGALEQLIHLESHPHNRISSKTLDNHKKSQHLDKAPHPTSYQPNLRTTISITKVYTTIITSIT